MSLSNIILPGTVIAELYKKSLIEDETLVGKVPERKAVVVEEAEPMAKTPVAEPKKEKPVVKTHVGEPVKEQPVAKTPTSQPTQQPAPETKAAGGYKTLGNNKRNISVIVHSANEVFVPEGELQFLTKMLGACKLNLADVAIVNQATSAIDITKLKDQLQPRTVILFGVEPTEIQLPITFPAFKEQPYAGTTYLYAPSLTQLNQESDAAKQAKKKLWDCLKRMFMS